MQKMESQLARSSDEASSSRIGLHSLEWLTTNVIWKFLNNQAVFTAVSCSLQSNRAPLLRTTLKLLIEH